MLFSSFCLDLWNRQFFELLFIKSENRQKFAERKNFDRTIQHDLFCVMITGTLVVLIIIFMHDVVIAFRYFATDATATIYDLLNKYNAILGSLFS